LLSSTEESAYPSLSENVPAVNLEIDGIHADLEQMTFQNTVEQISNGVESIESQEHEDDFDFGEHFFSKPIDKLVINLGEKITEIFFFHKIRISPI
jgi:hypothetical protein